MDEDERYPGLEFGNVPNEYSTFRVYKRYAQGKPLWQRDAPQNYF